ncbi:hypothetical protein I7I53_04721 [Histoplasma capsulatum var. duboisii H88]|uniref:Uncharacterized protein n=1 Tax=Ajellomyces capsulatus (strain H88) TaxID=544711 RepID=A0A8A1LVQ8_AJEC8|nr:hypothetical protein I7I53_04721 [Histoplasma capsulatum var. duboisii H88]
MRTMPNKLGKLKVNLEIFAQLPRMFPFDVCRGIHHCLHFLKCAV